jgi:adenine-specific DNA-methyltransferase
MCKIDLNILFVFNIFKMNDQFSSLSKDLTKKLDNNEKKQNGIYFTPKNIVIDMINICKKHNKKINRVLEPSCGSCQVINEVDKSFENVKIDGIELNNTIFTEIKALEHVNNVNLMNQDYLEYVPEDKYDLIIGNPPYFVMPKKSVDTKYHKYFDGRPNIFILFIIKGLMELKMNGLLAFVLPKNFLNCNYYNKLRQYIIDNYKIVSIKDHSGEKYIETGQETIVLIVQKKKSKVINKKYALTFDKNIIFNTKEGIKRLKEYYKGATSLKNMNFEVKVGNVVWNQVKDKLTDDNTKTRLIYSSDIVDNELCIKEYKNPEKKNFIDQEGSTDPLLVVNRGYGKGKYKFSYCLIDMEKKYLIENHLICIKSLEELERNILLEKYNLIINSLKSEKTKSFIELYCGNNALNTKELAEIVPIYIN